MQNSVLVPSKNDFFLKSHVIEPIETFLGLPYDYRMNGRDLMFTRNQKDIGNPLKIKSLIDFRFIDGTLQLGNYQYENPIQVLFIADNQKDKQFELASMLITLPAVKKVFEYEVDRLETIAKTAKVPPIAIPFEIKIFLVNSQKTQGHKFCQAEFTFDEEGKSDEAYLRSLIDFVKSNDIGFPDLSEVIIKNETINIDDFNDDPAF